MDTYNFAVSSLYLEFNLKIMFHANQDIHKIVIHLQIELKIALFSKSI